MEIYEEIDSRLKAAVEAGKQLTQQTFLINVTYENEKPCLWFINGKGEIQKYYDKTGHLPYLLVSPDEQRTIEKFASKYNVQHIERVTKFDAMKDENVVLLKPLVKTPLDIFNDFVHDGLRSKLSNPYEAKLHYKYRYLFDRNLFLFMPYEPEKIDETTINYKLEELFLSPIDKLAEIIDSFDCAIDIESEPFQNTRELENKKIVAISLFSRSEQYAKTLERDYKGNEKQMLIDYFLRWNFYKFFYTFVGDSYDLQHLHKRAKKLGIPEKDIPIKVLDEKSADIKNGIHIDLFKFFNIYAIKIYGFNDSYSNFPSLNELAKLFLGFGKLSDKKHIHELSQQELKEYVLNDALITYFITKVASIKPSPPEHTNVHPSPLTPSNPSSSSSNSVSGGPEPPSNPNPIYNSLDSINPSSEGGRSGQGRSKHETKDFLQATKDSSSISNSFSSSSSKISNNKDLDIVSSKTRNRHLLSGSEDRGLKVLLSDEIPEIPKGVGMVMKLIIVLSRITGLTLSDVCRGTIGGYDRMIFQRYHVQKNILIPNENSFKEKNLIKVPYGKKVDTIKGADIFEPIEGFYFNMFVFDYRGMYPTVIDEKNISYETIACKHVECQNNRVPDHDFHICVRKRGILSEITHEFRIIRDKFRRDGGSAEATPLLPLDNNWDKVIQGVIKVILNSTYGVFGDKDQKDLFCRPVSSATTAFARFFLHYGRGKVIEYGLEPVYGDTDGIFADNPNGVSKEKIMQMLAEIQKEKNVELRLDKEYQFCVLHAKKNYFGVTKEGKMDTKGLSGKKKHIPAIIKQCFRETQNILKNVDSYQSLNEAKKLIEQSCRKYSLRITQREFNLEDVAFTITLHQDINTTTGQAYDAARMLKSRGKEINVIDFRYILTSGMYSAKPLELVKKEEVSLIKLFQHMSSYMNQILVYFDMKFQDSTIPLDRYTNQKLKLEIVEEKRGFHVEIE